MFNDPVVMWAGLITLGIVVFWICLFGLIGERIGKWKGAPRIGFWLGAILGPLGWLITLVMPFAPEARRDNG